jgi:hypothetical protein
MLGSGYTSVMNSDAVKLGWAPWGDVPTLLKIWDRGVYIGEACSSVYQPWRADQLNIEVEICLTGQITPDQCCDNRSRASLTPSARSDALSTQVQEFAVARRVRVPWLQREMRASHFAFFMNVPTLLCLGLVLAYPVVYAAYLSVHRVGLAQLRRGEFPFNGLELQPGAEDPLFCRTQERADLHRHHRQRGSCWRCWFTAHQPDQRLTSRLTRFLICCLCHP